MYGVALQKIVYLPTGKILCLITDDLEGDGAITEAVLLQDLDGPDKCVPGRLVVMEQVSTQ